MSDRDHAGCCRQCKFDFMNYFTNYFTILRYSCHARNFITMLSHTSMQAWPGRMAVPFMAGRRQGPPSFSTLWATVTLKNPSKRGRQILISLV